MNRSVKEIESAIRVCNEQKLELEGELQKARCDAYGIHGGDLVKETRGGCREGRVVEIDFLCGNKPWVRCAVRKKDGSFGQALHQFYGDWVKV